MGYEGCGCQYGVMGSDGSGRFDFRHCVTCVSSQCVCNWSLTSSSPRKYPQTTPRPLFHTSHQTQSAASIYGTLEGGHVKYMCRQALPIGFFAITMSLIDLPALDPDDDVDMALCSSSSRIIYAYGRLWRPLPMAPPG